MLWFSPPVRVKTSRVGHILEVKSVETCIEQMRVWPKIGPKLRAAYPVCYGALEGSYTVEQAREAFIAAAKEAKVLLPSE